MIQSGEEIATISGIASPRQSPMMPRFKKKGSDQSPNPFDARESP